MKVPHAVAMGFAMFDQLFTGTIRGKEPRATIDAVKMGRKKMFASSAKAERELGYKVLPVEDALRRAVEWFQANRYVEFPAQAATVNA
jgi:dihydroflavonol-4-reductase